MTDLDLNAFAQEVHANAVSKGFWDTDRPWGETIALIHAELSEALEEHRAGRRRLWCEQFIDLEHGYRIVDGLPDDPTVKPEGWAVELADAAIRILDWVGREGTTISTGVRTRMKDRAFPDQIAWLHAGVSTAYMDGLGPPTGILLCILAVIGDDWPEILRAKHEFNRDHRGRLHGKAY